MIDSQVIELTPAIAGDLLQRNTGNRKVSRTTVLQYAGAMRRGEWQLNGEPIILGKNGRLLNGQHRCHAVVVAKVNVPVLVVSGVEDDAFKTLDTGKKRTAGDVLSITGVKNVHVVAAGARGILRLESGAVGGWNFTNAEVAACVEKHPLLQKWANKYAGASTKRVCSAVISGVLALAEERHGSIPCQMFFEKLASGVGLSADDPAHQLRERFIGRGNGVAFSQDYSLALCVKAVNAAMEGRKIALLRWGVREEMPVLA